MKSAGEREIAPLRRRNSTAFLRRQGQKSRDRFSLRRDLVLPVAALNGIFAQRSASAVFVLPENPNSANERMAAFTAMHMPAVEIPLIVVSVVAAFFAVHVTFLDNHHFCIRGMYGVRIMMPVMPGDTGGNQYRAADYDQDRFYRSE